MRALRVAAQLTIAGALLALGGLGVAATYRQFIPCEGVAQTAPSCLDAMDVPEHVPVLMLLWVIALGLTVTAAILARGRAARWVAVSGLLLVLVMNYVFEYAIWLGVWGGHWDVPPGTGYSMSAAMMCAGVLVIVSALLGMRRRHTMPAEVENESLVAV